MDSIPSFTNLTSKLIENTTKKNRDLPKMDLGTMEVKSTSDSTDFLRAHSLDSGKQEHSTCTSKNSRFGIQIAHNTYPNSHNSKP